MKVTIKLGGPLRERVSGHVDGLMTVDLADQARVSAALAAVSLAPGQVRVIMLNGRPIREDEPLKEGDRLALFPPELAYNGYVAINFFNNLIRGGSR